MASTNQHSFPAVATGVPKNPFATESKLDDIVWFLQKLTGPSLLLFSCIIGIFIVTNKVPESRVQSAGWIFQISMGSGLLAMGVNITGLLALNRRSNPQMNLLAEGATLMPQGQFNPVQSHDTPALPRALVPTEETRQSVALPLQEPMAQMLPGDNTEGPSFSRPTRDSEWIA